MRIQQLSESKNYLYEGLDYNSRSVMSLWESAGIKLKEAQLTPDQINSLFAQVEKSSTEAGGNRTMLGKGKDAASAVNKAWEDLKTKIQDSGPIKSVDQKYDDVVAKIERGLGGPDNAVNKVIQTYRKFAKEHPIAQGLIYSALIAAAGISGAGLGGAAVLGLLKMTDKLLQGEKFSSSAYSGAKTGAMAYGASKIGDYVKGKMADKDAFDAMGDAQAQRQALGQPDGATPGASLKVGQELPDGETISGLDSSNPNAAVTITKPDGGTYTVSRDTAQSMTGQTGISPQSTGPVSVGASSDPTAGVNDTGPSIASKAADVATSAAKPFGAGMDPDYLQRVVDAGGKSGVRFKINPEDAQKALDWQAQSGGQAGQAVQAATSVAADAATSAPFGGNMSTDYLQRVVDAGGKSGVRFKISPEDAAKALAWKAKQSAAESIIRASKPLSEGQVYLVFNRVCTLNNNIIAEGPMDAIKGFAGKAMGKARTIGTNLTTKVTADKLNSAWQKNGAPTDSEELKKFLTGQGVDAAVVDTVYKSLKIKSGVAATSMYAQVKTDLSKLDKKGKQRLAAYLQKQLGTA